MIKTVTLSFANLGLSPFDNLWWNIHDFTPSEEGQNWSLMGECYKVSGNFKKYSQGASLLINLRFN